MRLVSKIKNNSGFSLAELLVATLILLMVSAVVAGGIPTAREAYTKVTVKANAQVLLSTAITALRNELGPASEVSVASDGVTVSYISAGNGAESEICPDTDDTEGITLTTKAYSSGSSVGDKIRQLVSSEAATNDLYVTYESASYSGGLLTFENMEVLKEGDSSKVFAELAELDIRVIRD